MKPTGKQVALAAEAAVSAGYTYAEMDCQALIEHCVTQAGGKMAYRGSNDMARHAAWLGTIENAKAEGKLLPGCLLFIHEETEDNLPARYQGDGLGDFSHVGLYLGDGFHFEVVHSSASRGGVVASTLKNGWTHVGLAQEMDYGIPLEAGVELPFGIVADEADVASAEELTRGLDSDRVQGQGSLARKGAENQHGSGSSVPEGNAMAEELTAGYPPGATIKQYAFVTNSNGYPVKLRKSANAKEPIYWLVNPGARVEVERTHSGWALIRAICTDGHVRRAYMMQEFLKEV